MAVKRMDKVGIVVDDLGGAIDFLRELGPELEGRATEAGIRWYDSVWRC